MRLIILGSGTSGSNIKGIPNRYPPAFLVQWDNETLLFDCSEGVRFRLEKMGICYADLRHIAMSHAHPDHNALVNYIHSVAFRNHVLGHKGLDLNIYAPQQIVQDFPAVWKGYVPDDFAREEDIWPVLKFHALPNQSMPSMQIGSGKLEAFKVFHGSGKWMHWRIVLRHRKVCSLTLVTQVIVLAFARPVLELIFLCAKPPLK
jgi:ribonuclease BN (tRNA processing enzyme)